MNERTKEFLTALCFGVIIILGATSAKGTVTADETFCQAGQTHVCFTKQADGTLATVVTNGRGRAIVTHEECDDASLTVYFGCQPLELIRAKEREECDGLGGRWYWCASCNHGSGRCNESRPREREDDNPPPPSPPPQTPPAPPGPGVTTPPIAQSPAPPQSGSQNSGTNPPGGATPFCPPACPDCTCSVPLMGPDPCADVIGLAEELAPLERVSDEQWLVRTDTDTVRSRVYYIRDRAAECAEDGLFAATERILAAMEPPTPVPLSPDQITYQQEESCWDTWCPWVLGGAVATVVTGIILGVICGTGGCDPVIDVRNNP